MSAPLLCPYCGAKLFPHEVTNDQCASCGARLSGSPNWTPPVREEEPAQIAAPGRLEQSLTLPDRPPPEAFAAVRQGVHVVRWGVCLNWPFGAFMFACFGVSLIIKNPQYLNQAAREFGIFGMVLLFMSGLAVIVGVCLCCSAPRGSGAAKWARCVAPSTVNR